jgi:hypothetical protein
MQKLYLTFILTATILFETNPGWCAVPSTKNFKLSVTIPQMITLTKDLRASDKTQIASYSSQIVQEEQLKRDNRLALVKSIVAR